MFFYLTFNYNWSWVVTILCQYDIRKIIVIYLLPTIEIEYSNNNHLKIKFVNIIYLKKFLY